MSLELNALLDEVEHQRNVISSNSINNIRNANGQVIPDQNNFDDIDDNKDDLLIVTADDLADVRPLATPQEPMRRLAARREALAARQQQRKETHQELLRYPGWNYYLNLNSESTLLIIAIILTSLRLFGPLANDISSLFSSFTTHTTAIPTTIDSNIHDPYENDPLLSPTTTTTTALINHSITTFLSTRSITPLLVAFFAIIVYTQLPKLGRYTRVNTTLNITTSMPYPPPGIYLTHTLILLTIALALDFFSVCFFEYRILYHLYLNLPVGSAMASLPSSTQEHIQQTYGFYDFLPLLIQGFFIMYYFIMVLIQICLALLMMTECYCLYQSQRWWNNYTTSFQTKKRCFIIGSYNQINTLPLPLSTIPSTLILYTRIYLNFYYVFTIYYFKRLILRQTDTPMPTIFPYPIGDRSKFKRLIYKKFPFLQSQTLSTTTPSNNNTTTATTTPNDTNITTPHVHGPNCNHEHNKKGDEGGNSSSDDEEVENGEEKTSLLGGNPSNSATDPTLVIPCCILPPYIFPIQQTIFRGIWEGFVIHLVEFIKEYRESLNSIHRNATNGRPLDYSESNNGPAM